MLTHGRNDSGGVCHHAIDVGRAIDEDAHGQYGTLYGRYFRGQRHVERFLRAGRCGQQDYEK
ncbi:MAG: hypothetical protein AAF089_10890 [Bacteroidota bacterium]